MRQRLLGVLIALMVGVLSFSVPVMAATNEGGWNNCGGDIDSSAAIEAMCSDITDSNKNISVTVKGILNTVIGITGILGAIGVIYGGFMVGTAAGDPAKVKKGKDALTYSIIGLAVVALSWAIVSLVITYVIAD